MLEASIWSPKNDGVNEGVDDWAFEEIKLNFFDIAGLATAALVSCSDPVCNSAVQTASH